ncbi:MAG TPA: sigma-70 family RNA polymerase sigma factor [Burkholderiales bacterium]|jgi:RNA polymerase sigma-70 factor (ECF subfamily)|nr:sigma-70 family RNA polymerase sigma factor [Burkholderiales bacterium]
MPQPAPSTALPAELEGHRAYLYRYAMLQLRDASGAEDVVQETLLAALESRSAFAGRSSLKTWLTGILKHKITDLIRSQSREVQPEALRTGDDPEEARAYADQFFDRARRDHWHAPPQAWEDPELSLEQKRFWEVFERCSAALPRQTARVFAMRELMGLSTESICKELDISPTNCWVILYRARMALRECLELNWFGEPQARDPA